MGIGWYNRPVMHHRRCGVAFGRLLLLTACALLGSGSGVLARADSVAWRRVPVSGIVVNVVDVDLNDPQVRIGACVARGFPRGCESFRSMIDRARPDAAINGTFFSKTSLHPVGDVVIAGAQVFKGGVGTALAATAKGQIDFLPARGYRQRDWSGYETVVAAGPRLLSGGRIALAPQHEGFRDRRVISGSAPRSAAGVTAGRHLLLVTVPRAITLRKLATIMLSLGARDAINLDGGASSALYCRDRVLTAPGRSLTNLLVVYCDAERYRAAAASLVPSPLPPKAKPPESPAPPPKVAMPFEIVRPRVEGAVSGKISIMACARDSISPEYVTFTVDGRMVGVTNRAPYACTWDTREVSDGSHRIVAYAYKKGGAVAGTAEMEVTVANSATAPLPHAAAGD